MKARVNIFWFRRDLRLHDNAGLYHALKGDRPVVPIFIFDADILDDLEDKKDRRLQFIFEVLDDINKILHEKRSTLDVRYGVPLQVFETLVNDYEIGTVFTNHDYEPYARQRDATVTARLKEQGIGFRSFKDQVVLEKGELVKDDGKPYTVFTPFSRKWDAFVNDFYLASYPTEKYMANLCQMESRQLPSLGSMGFRHTRSGFPSSQPPEQVIRNYDKTRDIPSIAGTSRISIHLRFGTVSIREVFRQNGQLNATYRKELIWREFYQSVLWFFPQVQTESFKKEYDAIQWRNNETEFEAWCAGNTGYPIVDAGMRELNETGFMHNRVRMITASFLCKHLLIDWRWGEAYFAKKLLDYDLASNNGGWQWAAGSGCDSAPYFRVFNPYLQTSKFDPELKYVRKWVPEFEEFTYPAPIVEHVFARKRCLEVYAAALRK
ncbi:MAG: deoxyribodipyrimidine photo-lyase [Chitinophagaceae bacterium]